MMFEEIIEEAIETTVNIIVNNKVSPRRKKNPDNRTPVEIFLNTLIGYLGEEYFKKKMEEELGKTLKKVKTYPQSSLYDFIDEEGKKWEIKTSNEFNINSDEGNNTFYKTLKADTWQSESAEKKDLNPEDEETDSFDYLVVIKKKSDDRDIYSDFMTCKDNFNFSKHFEIVGYISRQDFNKYKKQIGDYYFLDSKHFTILS